MKAKLSKAATSFALIKFVIVAIIMSGCSDSEVSPSRPSVDNDSFDSFEASDEEYGNSASRKSCSQEGPHYNLNVVLTGDNTAFGVIKFRQRKNETQLIHLDTWVSNLEPNTTYLLQRAVDTMLDGDCTGTSWLTLGEGLEPQSILTNCNGSGKAELFRSVATIPVGSTFDIHFQIVKESTSEVVLSSGCYEYTVK